MIIKSRTWREERRLDVAATAMIHVIEHEAVGWDLDDPAGDDDQLDLDLVVRRWFGKPIAEAYRELKDAARG